jgi:hypothetical protein
MCYFGAIVVAGTYMVHFRLVLDHVDIMAV